VKIFVVAVGLRMPAWVDAGFEEYAKRMPREVQFGLIEVKPEPRSDHDSRNVDRLTGAEGKRIDSALPKGGYKGVLDERGRTCTTRELAEKIAAWQMDGRDVAFVIGGPDGLADAIKREADFTWSLTPLTLPHGLVRVVLAEQLYRAYSLLKGHPYHRD
jgi:23S rRNA (pseudouridine1915-N3)-methyltransferase